MIYEVESYHSNSSSHIYPSGPVNLGKCGRRELQVGIRARFILFAWCLVFILISDTLRWYHSMVQPLDQMDRMWLSCMHVGCICACYVCMMKVIVIVVFSCRS